PPGSIADPFRQMTIPEQTAYLHILVGKPVLSQEQRPCRFRGEVLALPLDFQRPSGQAFARLLAILGPFRFARDRLREPGCARPGEGGACVCAPLGAESEDWRPSRRHWCSGTPSGPAGTPSGPARSPPRGSSRDGATCGLPAPPIAQSSPSRV